MSTAVETSTEAVYRHHMQAFLARDADDIMQDYTEDSVVIVHTVPEPLRGLPAIRGLFDQVAEMLTPELMASFETHRESIVGEVAYVVWSVGKAIPFASDTFVIRDGKIAYQTAAALMAQGG